MVRSLTRVSCLCIATLALAAWPAASANDPATLAPSDAMLFVGATDAQQVWEKYKKTNDYKVFEDPALKEGMGDVSEISKLIDRFREKLASALDVKTDELKNPFKGPIALYLTAERGAKSPDIVFIGTIGDTELINRYFEAATRKMKAIATEARVAESGSHQIHVFKNTRPAEGEDGDTAGDDDLDIDEASDQWGQLSKSIDTLFSPDAMPEEMALVKTSEQLLVTNSEAAAKRALQRDREDSLAGHDDNKAMLRLLEPAGEVRFFVNIPRIVDQARTEAAEDADLQKTLRAMGVDSMRSFAGHMQIGEEDFESKAESILLMSGERTGLAKLISFNNRPIAPPATVDASTVMFASWNVDPPAFLDEIERMTRQVDPQQADAMRQSLENAPIGEQPVNLRKDLFDNLSGPIHFGLDLRPPYEPDEVRLTLTIGSRNRDPIARLLGMVPLFTQRDFRGTTLYTMPVPFPITAAVTSDRIVVGTPPGVETALIGESASQLAESAAFRRASRHVPAEAWLTVFFDEQRATDAFLKYQEKSQELEASNNLGAMLVGSLSEAMMGSVKPDSEAARKLRTYRGASMMTVSTTTDGVRMTAVKVKGDQSR